jgi:hypothetical protein
MMRCCAALLVLSHCSCTINAFIVLPSFSAASPAQTLRKAANSGDINLESALANARANLEAGVSPGAGLATADEQADAAYADLILTSVIEKVSVHALIGVAAATAAVRVLHYCTPLGND